MGNEIFHSLFFYKGLIIPLFGAVVTGLSIYLVLASTQLLMDITILLCVMVSVIVYGLSNLYVGKNTVTLPNKDVIIKKNTNTKYRNEIPNILFLGLYLSILLILIIPYPSESNLELFVPWTALNLAEIMKLGASILMTFFLPGYAIVASTFGSQLRLSLLLKVLLSYLLSMFIAGITVYSATILGFTISEANLILILMYFAIITIFTLKLLPISAIRESTNAISLSKYLANMRIFFRTYVWHCVVYFGIFGLIILSTYSLYGGIIIGDQWFHHGRALLYLTGTYKDFFENKADDLYLPLPPALLFSLFYLSSIPSVNAYASIAFLNIIPAFAYYFFFVQWVPPRKKRAALLASALLVLGSGFGWIEALGVSISHPPADGRGALLNINIAGRQTYDILTPSTFFLASHPDFSTPLQLITLPAGFVLLGLMKYETSNPNTRKNKICLFVTLTIITLLGIFSHDEFYIFIIIASLVPILLNLRNKTVIYLSLACSISTILLLDTISTTQYFTTIWLFGLPLIILVLIFVVLTGVIYATGGFRVIMTKFKQLMSSSKLNSTASIASIIIIVGIAYWYVVGLLVWQDIHIQTIFAEEGDKNDVPWFVYPMKLGTIGILGSIYLVSYFFKRFEKEIFIFGIIILVALLTGSYYDEHRFSKYIMAGMAGFASLLVYELIIGIRNMSVRPLITGLIIAIVFASCSISVLMFIGFHALALDTNNLDLAFRRRDSPTGSEFQMLSFLQPHGPINQSYNIATFSKEYELRKPLTSYFQAFSAIPTSMLLKTPYLLNSSSLEDFYDQLEENNIKYLVLARKDISSRNSIPSAVSFAISNFKIAYEDKNYIILNVPNLAPSKPPAETVLVYQRDPILSKEGIVDSTLYFNDTSFRIPNNTNLFKVTEGGKVGQVTLSEPDSSYTLWSRDIQKKQINYIQIKFQILNETAIGKSHCGIVWEDVNDKKYYTNLGNDTLRFAETPRSNDTKIFEAQTVAMETMKWYTMKLLFIDGRTHVYLNDIPVLEIPLDAKEHFIKNVGIRCYNNAAEFQPVVISRVPDPPIYYDNPIYLEYYYPLSGLALSNVEYDTAVSGDRSVFSKKNIMLVNEPPDENELNAYLDFAKQGGNLFIVYSDLNFGASISRLFGIHFANDSRYDSISDVRTGKSVSTSGSVKSIQLDLEDNHIVSFYEDDGDPVAPFTTQRTYGKGNITLINAGSYFESILEKPQQYFPTLSNFAELIGTNFSHYVKKNLINSTFPIRFVGDMSINGHVTMNSSSIDLGFDDAHDGLYVRKISIVDDENGADKYILENKKITKMDTVGEYEAIINGEGHSNLPSSLSFGDYLRISVPQGFNMTIKLSNMSSVNLMTEDGTDKVKIAGKTIRFDGVMTDRSDSAADIQIIMKSPEIRVIDGESNFERLYVGEFDPFLLDSPLGQKTELKGNLTTKVDHVDTINYRDDDNHQRTKYTTFITSLNYDPWGDFEILPTFKIPGDLPDDLIEKNIDVISKRIITSATGILSLLLIVSVTIAFAYLYRRKFPLVRLKP